MNTPATYIRDTQMVMSTDGKDQPSPVHHVAVHGDPSVRRSPVAGPGTAGRSVTWVRPSELPTMVGTSAASRALAVHSTWAGRVRRAPARVTRSAVARATVGPQPEQTGGPSL